MSDPNPYEQLGVSENASFEEIQAAKQLAVARSGNDAQLMDKLEAAYDAILMERLKMRQQGKIKVPDDVRFGETPTSANAPKSIPIKLPQPKGWLNDLFTLPDTKSILTTTAVYIGLAGLSSVPAIASQSLPLLLAFGLAFSLYFINNKSRNFKKALLSSFGAVLLGILLGGLLVNYGLGESLATIGFDPTIVAALCAYLLLWIAASFSK
jgi:hypothetical protein